MEVWVVQYCLSTQSGAPEVLLFNLNVQMLHYASKLVCVIVIIDNQTLNDVDEDDVDRNADTKDKKVLAVYCIISQNC